MREKVILQVLIFYLVAIGFSWSAWLPLALAGGAPGTPLQLLHFLGGLGPAVGALVAASVFGGKRGAISFVQRARQWRAKPWLYVTAIAGPFILLAGANGVAPFLGGTPLNWSNLLANAEFPGLTPLLYVAAILVFYGFGEEIGWRGYLAPLLDARWGLFVSIVVVSILWAIWHLPLFWFSPGMREMGIPGAAGWFFSLLAGAALLSWFARQAKGGVLLPAIFHATMDLAFVTNAGPVTASIVGAAVTICGVGAMGWSWRQAASVAQRAPNVG
ncbi:MAG: type II CAAX endopeptidase family protein [Devosia sp.]